MGESMRDDFEQAITEVEDGAPPETEVVETPPEPQAIEESDAPPAEAEEETTSETQVDEVRGETPEPPSDTGSDPEVEKNVAKAPASWSPTAREHWADIPDQAREQIMRREQQINKALQDGAEHRKMGEKFNQLTSQYQTLMAAEGTPDAFTGVKGLMDTAALLRMGTPQQKAQRMAQMIQHYGIGIEDLDGALAGVIAPNNAPPSANSTVEAMLEQRLAPVNDLLAKVQRAEAERETRLAQDVNQNLEAFAQEHEFTADVANDMADLLSMAAQRGVQMTLDEAYAKACAFNPEVSSAIKQREERERLVGSQQKMAAKRNAASSIAGRPSGGGNGGAGDDLRSQLEHLWDTQNG